MIRLLETIKLRENKKELFPVKWDELEEELTEKIETYEISEIVIQMGQLAEKVNENALLYDSIISDDASGRLVSLFLKRVLDRTREKEGLGPLRINFIAAGKHEIRKKRKTIEDFLKEEKEKLGKVLLVTELIASGKSIRKITKVLESLKIPFDVAALSVFEEGEENIKESGFKGKLYYGDSYSAGEVIYNKPHMAGVEKPRIFGRKDLDKLSPFPEKFKGHNPNDPEEKKIQKSITQARKDIYLLAERVSNIIDKN